MIIGHLNALPLAGLPPRLRAILTHPDCRLAALQAREDGRWQPEGAQWFCNIGPARTQPTAQRHTEYHRQWADIQVVLEGEEIINAATLEAAAEDDEERRPDLFISQHARHGVAITLRPGDFALFMPGEPHQALCTVAEPRTVRKAVFKVPLALLEV
ncbi:YhcH/YjgK/YiaL family protein [Intestinirhabdus alba]|jgi:biofilm protein TabA|uniref:YhcH/YjgK/YiaL family protein n=1 Tax=Intestinirhabdus alba TaxID=2899544 RepID=A0A6L6IGU1_9ENTR|nr:YhcH/YjgK/YiaL family protein [Intestinirhabdus alba]MTH46072.1 YhcH/YjgK/YiaL family protein [Intestinirhabdus alba]